MKTSDVLIEWCEEQGWAAWVVGPTIIAIRLYQSNVKCNVLLDVYGTKVSIADCWSTNGPHKSASYCFDVADPDFFDKLDLMFIKIFSIRAL